MYYSEQFLSSNCQETDNTNSRFYIIAFQIGEQIKIKYGHSIVLALNISAVNFCSVSSRAVPIHSISRRNPSVGRRSRSGLRTEILFCFLFVQDPDMKQPLCLSYSHISLLEQK